MKYIFAGKKETYNKFLKEYRLNEILDTTYVKSRSILKEFNCDEDVMVLLTGWAFKDTNKYIVQKLLCNYGEDLKCQFADGEFGRREREKLAKKHLKGKPFTRFDIMDI